MARRNQRNIVNEFKELIASIKSGKAAPVLVVCGPEDFFIDRVIKAAKNIIPEDLHSFNLDMMYADELSIDKVLGALRSFPMMAEKRVVIIKNGLSLSGINSKAGQPQKLLLDYIQKPNPTTFFVFTDTKNLNKKTSLGKALASSGEHHFFFDAQTVSENQLTEWIVEWVQVEYQKEIDVTAAELLWNLAGNSLTLIDTEIEKVLTYIGDKNRIEVEDVKATVGLHREFSIFELKDAVLKARENHALQIARQQMEIYGAAGEVIKTIGFFYSYFSNVWQLHMYMHKGMDIKSVEQQTGMNAWVLKRNWEEARRIPAKSIPFIMETLLDADRAIKGMSLHNAEGIMFMMLRKMIQAMKDRF